MGVALSSVYAHILEGERSGFGEEGKKMGRNKKLVRFDWFLVVRGV